MSSPILADGGRPSEDDLIKALAIYFDAPECAAVAWLSGIHQHFDAKAATERIAAQSTYTMFEEHK
jgi:hypothetical protein